MLLASSGLRREVRGSSIRSRRTKRFVVDTSLVIEVWPRPSLLFLSLTDLSNDAYLEALPIPLVAYFQAFELAGQIRVDTSAVRLLPKASVGVLSFLSASSRWLLSSEPWPTLCLPHDQRSPSSSRCAVKSAAKAQPSAFRFAISPSQNALGFGLRCLGRAVDLDEAEFRAVAFEPFEIVEHRPVDVAAHVDAVGDRSAARLRARGACIRCGACRLPCRCRSR